MKLKFILKVARILIIVFILSVAGRKEAFAGVILSVSPASGAFTVGQNIVVDVMLNTNSSSTTGVQVNYNFTGPVTFQSGAVGTVDCGVLFIAQSLTAGTVNVECADLENLPSGSIAKLTFATSGAGTFTLTSASADGGDTTVDSSTGGSYTVSVASGGTGGGTGDDTNDETGGSLPYTADLSVVVPGTLGLLLFLGGIGWRLSQYNWAYMFDKRRGFETKFNSQYEDEAKEK